MLVTEPIIRTHRILIEPDELRLNRNHAQAVGDDAASKVASLVYGSCLEWLAAEWLLTHAAPATLGGSPHLVGPAVLGGGPNRMPLDIVAVQPDRTGKTRSF